MSTDFLRATYFVDSGAPEVVHWSKAICQGAATCRERASALFIAVRDGIHYDPYSVSSRREDYRASAIVGRRRAFCTPKAILLAAGARAVGVPARLGFADVRNHLSSEKLRQTMGTDVFAYHGYVELWIENRWHKCTPAFNAALCHRFGVPPLELDFASDAMLQAVDGEGRRFMEYVRERGTYADLPFDEMMLAFRALYGEAPTPTEADEVFA